MKTSQLLIAASLAVTAFSLPTSASAEERACRGNLGAVTVDNVRVPPNATCTMRKTRVKGTVKVEANATLNAVDVLVIGNVQAEKALSVSVTGGSRIGGSVQMVQGKRANVANSRIDADILYNSNTQRLVASGNVVGGDIQAFQNRGGVVIQRNTVDGNLQCKANTPKPTGGSNVVQGNKQDQCRLL